MTNLRGNRAAIDCGTNSTRLLIVDSNGNSLCEELRITRLGEGVHATRTLSADAIERSVMALNEFRDLLDKWNFDAVRAVATSAARDATNSSQFFDAARQTLGFDVEVITGMEEARLSFAGATEGRSHDKWHLVVDVGGGSTEFVLGRGDELAFVHSFDLGCIRLTEMFLHSDPPGPVELQQLHHLVVEQLSKTELVALVEAKQPELVAVAGTATSLAAIDLRLDTFESYRVHGHVLSAERVSELHHRLNSQTTAERTSGAVPPGRAEVIVAGTAVLEAVLQILGTTRVTVSVADILRGLVA